MLKLKDTSKNAKIAILGFGREGKSSLRFLLTLDFTNITILDTSTTITGIPENIKTCLGDGYTKNLGGFDIIVKSPGISPYQTDILPYKNICISQTQIFFEYYGGKVIGITGTKGKSTVSSLLYKSLIEAGYKSKLVGNIGAPVLDEIDLLKQEKYDYVVYELSSYMLEEFSPKLFIGYINNIYECHLDWHENMKNYSQAKKNILPHANTTITHASLSGGEKIFPSKTGYSFKNLSFYYNGTMFLETPQMNLLGDHNMENICGILTILDLILIDRNQLKIIITRTLLAFPPLPHRLENLGVYGDITFIDDGAAVTPEATILAIKALGNKAQTLLIGGKDLGTNQERLKKYIFNSSITNIILFPDTGYTLFSPETDVLAEDKVLSISFYGKTYNILKTRSMEEAIKFTYYYTAPKKTVLLSSSAQSYLLWKNFEEKGELYKKYIKQYEVI